MIADEQDSLEVWHADRASAAKSIFGAVLGPALADAVLQQGEDVTVCEGAWDEVCDLADKIERDRLRVTDTPFGRNTLGYYNTRAYRQAPEPYCTLFFSTTAPFGSCDCTAFKQNSLGLCVHLLRVLMHLAALPRRWNRARRESRTPQHLTTTQHLGWSPIRPLSGAGDWASRLRLWPATAGRQLLRLDMPPVAQLFRQDGALRSGSRHSPG